MSFFKSIIDSILSLFSSKKYDKDGYDNEGFDRHGKNFLGFTKADIKKNVYDPAFKFFKKAQAADKEKDYKSAAYFCRLSLETIYSFLVKHYRFVDKDFKTNNLRVMIDIAHEHKLLSDDEYSKVHNARKHGNQGAHAGYRVSRNQAFFTMKVTETELARVEAITK